MAKDKVSAETKGDFIEQLRRIVAASGGVDALAGSAQVHAKTLARWLKGEVPSVNYTNNLTRVDEQGRKLIPGYPAGAGGDKSLTELIVGPNPVVMTAPSLPTAEDESSVEVSPESTDTKEARPGLKKVLFGAASLLALVILVSLAAVGIHGLLANNSPAGAPTYSSGNIVPGRLPPRPGLTVEVAAGRSGVPVFSDNTGAVVPDRVRASIPYGTAVYVKCREPNASTMSSVAWFYKIVGGEWDQQAAVSNGFQNGDKFGITGGHVVDLRIPKCP